MSNKRGNLDGDYLANAIIADKGCGKSSLIVRLAKAYIKKSQMSGDPRPVLIVDPAGSRAFLDIPEITLYELRTGCKEGSGNTKGIAFENRSGIFRLTPPKSVPHKDIIEVLQKYCRNCCIFLDESNKYLKGAVLPSWAYAFITEHRNYCIELYCVFHSLTDVASDIRGHLFKYYISVTTDSLPLPFPNLAGASDYDAKTKARNIRYTIDLLSKRKFPAADRVYFAYAYMKKRGKDYTVIMQDFILIDKENNQDYIISVDNSNNLTSKEIFIDEKVIENTKRNAPKPTLLEFAADIPKTPIKTLLKPAAKPKTIIVKPKVKKK